MKTKLDTLKTQALSAIEATQTVTDLESVKVQFFGKKGELTEVMKVMAQLSADERPVFGKLVNDVKSELLALIDEKNRALGEKELLAKLEQDDSDPTLPSRRTPPGKIHPINQVIDEAVGIFSRLGYAVKEGPDIESEYYNFEALNIPADHPARDMHDTFYLNSGKLLRTHTSPVQIRTMEKEKPPIKIIVPGKVYRMDADVTHSPVFHQIEGLYVDKYVTFADLKGTLEFFLKELFGKEHAVRFRPSYFPFTEPSTEVDVQCVQCKGKGCGMCKHTGWLEILGAGMVNRNVFRSVNYNPDEVTGFAFGLGIERIAMIKFEINDIRLFYENDVRFLRQF